MALVSARQEALRLGHPYVGAEHILLGVLVTANGVAATVLSPADTLRIRSEIERTVGGGSVEPPSAGELPYTSRAKRVLELAMREALELQHEAVGGEHLLLALLREERGIAFAALTGVGLRLEAVRAIVTNRAAGGKSQPTSRLRRLLLWIADRFGMLPRG